MILVTGATGQSGAAVVRSLLAQNCGPIRAIYRDEKDRTKLPAKVEAVRADFSAVPSLRRALTGVDAAFLVCAPIPQLVELECNFLDAASAEKTPYLVIQSALGAANFSKSFPSWHRQVEAHAIKLNIPCTIIRPNGFMQNIAGFFAGTIKTQNAFYDALGNARISYIDSRDIADAAARLLIEKSAVGKIFELSGPEALSNYDIAERISKLTNRAVRYIPLTLDQMKQGMISAGMPEAKAAPVVELYEYYCSGAGAAPDAALRSLLTRAPRTIDQYLIEISSLFTK